MVTQVMLGVISLCFHCSMCFLACVLLAALSVPYMVIPNTHSGFGVGDVVNMGGLVP